MKSEEELQALLIYPTYYHRQPINHAIADWTVAA